MIQITTDYTWENIAAAVSAVQTVIGYEGKGSVEVRVLSESLAFNAEPEKDSE